MKLTQAKLRKYYQRKLIELERTRTDLAKKIDRAYEQMDISTSMALEARYAAVVVNIASIRQQLNKFQPSPVLA